MRVALRDHDDGGGSAVAGDAATLGDVYTKPGRAEVAGRTLKAIEGRLGMAATQEQTDDR